MAQDAEDPYVHEPASAESDAEGLSERQSWLLVGVLAFAGIVAPGIVYLWPPAFLSFENAYMAAAMVPALILAVAALWSVQASRN
ncbi:hypothetical protein [Halarchaeum sp. P4]|uniref:hypothetical protein n=1 Tax=Halarchaeum sp. P4 TaxID=3421639 RepID=UPI003EBAFB45